MPIYEYKCSECGNIYEKRQKFSDPVDTVCNCEKQGAVSRITSAPALVFKGSGWYVNDYARAGKGGPGGKSDNGTKAETGEKKSDPGSSAASSDSGAKSSTETSSGSSSSSSSSESASKPSGTSKPS